MCLGGGGGKPPPPDKAAEAEQEQKREEAEKTVKPKRKWIAQKVRVIRPGEE